MDNRRPGIHQVHAEYHIGGFALSRSWIGRHLVRSLFEKIERPFVTELIYLPQSDSIAYTRLLTNRLRQNAILSITADGKRGQKFIFRKWLGYDDFFATGIVSLARLSGAPILPVFCVREKPDHFRLIIEPAIRIEASGTSESCAQSAFAEYLDLLESYVKKYPEQYRNWHGTGAAPIVRRRDR